MARSRAIGRNKTSIRKVNLPRRFSIFKREKYGSQPEGITAQQRLLQSWEWVTFLVNFLADYPVRMCTAVALTASSIRIIKKDKMLQMIRGKNKTSRSLLAHLLSSVKNYRDHLADLLTCSAEQRLAHVLSRLAHLGKSGQISVDIPLLSDKVLAEMVGTTRSRVNVFMNRFQKQGFISYNGRIEVHPSLRKAFGTR